MKVLEAISDTNVGGAGRLLLTRLRHSDRTAVQTTVVLPKGSALEERLFRIGIRTVSVTHGADASADLRALPELVRIMREHRPDVLHCHGWLAARLAGWLAGVPVRIHTRHCAYRAGRWLRIPPVRLLCGLVQGMLSTNVIAVAEAAREDLLSQGVSDKKIEVIINGTDPLRTVSRTARYIYREAYGFSPEHFVVGICARLEPCKGHGDFLRAAALLASDDRFRFLVVGTGSLEKDLHELARGLGLEKKIVFAGFCEDVSIPFWCMDLNVNCSVGTETSCLSLSEGMSIGLPAVASSYGGNVHMVKHGTNGLIYPEGDFVALAAAIRQMADDREGYRRMSAAARRRYCEEFTADRMTRATEGLYHRAVAGKTGAV